MSIEQTVSRRSSTSLILGFLALVFAGWSYLLVSRSFENGIGLLALMCSAITGLSAIIWGIRALVGIRRNPDLPRERAFAWTGLVTGVGGTGLGSLLLLVAIENVQEAADRSH